MMAHSYFPHTLNYLCITVLLSTRIPFNLASVVALNATVEGNELKSELETCSSPECDLVASEVVKYMSKSVHLCDDFYEFSCGQFDQDVLNYKQKAKIYVNEFIAEEFQKQYDALITESPSDSDPKHFHLANNFYKSCMNESYIEELKGSPMTEISNSVGGWPVLMKNKWNPNSTWTWEEATKKLYKLGFESGAIFNISYEIQEIKIDCMNPNIPEMMLLDRRSALKNIDSLGSLPYKHTKNFVYDFLIHSDRLKFFSYYKYMVDIAVLFGAERDFAKKGFENCLRFALDFEEIINKERRFMNTTFKELPKYYSNDWVNYLKSLSPEDQLISENKTVHLPHPKLFEELSTLLKNTPNETIANFIMWRVHNYSTQFLSKSFRDRRASYYSLKNPQPIKERSKECMDITKSRLLTSINSQWAHKYFSFDKHAEAFKMFENIRASFKEFIEESDWMDNATKAISQDRLKSLSININFPNELLNNTKMEEYFHGLDIDSKNYFESNLRLNIFFSKKQNEMFRFKVPHHVDATYYVKKHVAVLDPLMLHDRIFNAKIPQYANFGYLGVEVAHLIVHGIFMTRNWTNGSEQAYQTKLNCLINQYGNFSTYWTGRHIDGHRTADSNLADNIGLKVAFEAYKKWNEEFGPEKPLPGLKYTPQQLFWIVNGQRWCSNHRRPDIEAYVIGTSDRSPIRFRVKAPRQNNKEFAADFNCAEGTKMNPVKKCIF